MRIGVRAHDLGKDTADLLAEKVAARGLKCAQIAVLSCYINPIHPDEGERAKQIELFKEHLRFVRDFGCGIVATETGSVNLLSMDNYPERDRIIEDSFDLFGDRIAAVHAKDFRVEAGRMPILCRHPRVGFSTIVVAHRTDPTASLAFSFFGKLM